MKLSAYLLFNGNCKQAFDFYKELFNATDALCTTYGQTPPNPDFPMPKSAENLVMHGTMNLAGSVLMFGDVFPGTPYEAKNDQITLVISAVSAEDARRYYDVLKVDGIEIIPIEKTFFSGAYGKVQDRFGVNWQISADAAEEAEEV